MTRFEFIRQKTGVDIPKEFREKPELAKCYCDSYVEGYDSVINQVGWRYSICKVTSNNCAYLWNQSSVVICAYLDGVRDAVICSREDIERLPIKDS